MPMAVRLHWCTRVTVPPPSPTPTPFCCCATAAGVQGAWALHHTPDGAADAGALHQPGTASERHHSYLLLGFQGSTKVLATGEELREVSWGGWGLGFGISGLEPREVRGGWVGRRVGW